MKAQKFVWFKAGFLSPAELREAAIQMGYESTTIEPKSLNPAIRSSTLTRRWIRADSCPRVICVGPIRLVFLNSGKASLGVNNLLQSYTAPRKGSVFEDGWVPTSKEGMQAIVARQSIWGCAGYLNQGQWRVWISVLFPVCQIYEGYISLRQDNHNLIIPQRTEISLATLLLNLYYISLKKLISTTRF